MEIINITQTIKRIGQRDYIVKMKTEIEEGSIVQEFEYNDSNGIYPLYNSLINTIRQYNNVHINLMTSSKVFVEEVNGSLRKNGRLYQILEETKEQQSVEVDVFYIENN